MPFSYSFGIFLDDLFSKRGFSLSEEPAPARAPNWGICAEFSVRKTHPLLKGGQWEGGEAAGPGKGELRGWAAVGRVAGGAAPCSSCSWAAWMGLCRCQPASIFSIFCWTQLPVFASSEACWLYTEAARDSEMRKRGYRAKKGGTKVWHCCGEC